MTILFFDNNSYYCYNYIWKKKDVCYYLSTSYFLFDRYIYTYLKEMVKWSLTCSLLSLD